MLTVEDDAFSCCSSLVSIVFPDSITEIGKNVCQSATALKNVTLPSNLEKIGDWAFSFCTEIEEITIPESVKKISSDAFSCDSNLTMHVTKGSAAEKFAKKSYFVKYDYSK